MWLMIQQRCGLIHTSRDKHWDANGTVHTHKSYTYMTTSLINVPSQKFPVPKITMQTKSHNLNFNVLSSVVVSSGD